MNAKTDGVGDEPSNLKIYEIYLNDLGRIGSRHETARQFYITVITAIFAFLGLAGREGVLTNIADIVKFIACLAGGLICITWLRHMRSFGVLFSGKLAVIREIEKSLPSKPFTEEQKNVELQSRARLTDIDWWTALAFALLFVLLAVYSGFPSRAG